jgi:hypothetical protein
VRAAILVWSLLLAGPISLFAQQEDSLGTALDDSTAADVGTLVLAGTGGMVAGAFGVGLIGAELDPDSGLDDAEGAIIGGLIGTTFAIPIAVHLANRSRGNLGRSILVSALVGGALLGLGAAVESGELIIAAPFVQLITSVLIEHDTRDDVYLPASR